MCGELIFSVSQYLSLSRLFPTSIDAFLVVVHSSGAGVVPKGKCIHRKAGLYTVSMQVDGVVSFA